jgi:hypothetical protein
MPQLALIRKWSFIVLRDLGILRDPLIQFKLNYCKKETQRIPIIYYCKAYLRLCTSQLTHTPPGKNGKYLFTVKYTSAGCSRSEIKSSI